MCAALREHTFPSGQVFQIVQGDLAAEQVDAIVNAANSQLQHGGGVAGSIARRGGAVIQQESDAWVREHGPVSHAQPAWTTGGNLPAKYVIHAVGPIWGDAQSMGAGGDEDAKLAAAVGGSLEVADRLALASVSLPAISTGIFGFPAARAASVIFHAIEKYLAEHPNSGLKQVRLVLFDQPTLQTFLSVWDGLGNQ
jgi:O-acetyl-ADP-ribose deacetylase (regulator of RNase III)